MNKEQFKARRQAQIAERQTKRSERKADRQTRWAGRKEKMAKRYKAVSNSSPDRKRQAKLAGMVIKARNAGY